MKPWCSGGSVSPHWDVLSGTVRFKYDCCLYLCHYMTLGSSNSMTQEKTREIVWILNPVFGLGLVWCPNLIQLIAQQDRKLFPPWCSEPCKMLERNVGLGWELGQESSCLARMRTRLPICNNLIKLVWQGKPAIPVLGRHQGGSQGLLVIQCISKTNGRLFLKNTINK